MPSKNHSIELNKKYLDLLVSLGGGNPGTILLGE